MKERPITFRAAEVRAIREGLKTQFRRIIEPQPDCWSYDGPPKLDSFGTFSYPAGASGRWACPYGQPRDRLWVRETFLHEAAEYDHALSIKPYREASTVYRADVQCGGKGTKWRSSTQMPRELSRILLEIESVRVERLQDITEDGATAEGDDPLSWFAHCWRKFWAENPWVWVVEFRVVEGGTNESKEEIKPKQVRK